MIRGSFGIRVYNFGLQGSLFRAMMSCMKCISEADISSFAAE